MTSFLPGASSGHPSVLSTPQAELPSQAPLPASKGHCWPALMSPCYWEAEPLRQCAAHPSPLPAACRSGPLVHPFSNHGFVYSETGRQRLIMGRTGSSHFLSSEHHKPLPSNSSKCYFSNLSHVAQTEAQHCRAAEDQLGLHNNRIRRPAGS